MKMKEAFEVEVVVISEERLLESVKTETELYYDCGDDRVFYKQYLHLCGKKLKGIHYPLTGAYALCVDEEKGLWAQTTSFFFNGIPEIKENCFE